MGIPKKLDFIARDRLVAANRCVYCTVLIVTRSRASCCRLAKVQSAMKTTYSLGQKTRKNGAAAIVTGAPYKIQPSTNETCETSSGPPVGKPGMSEPKCLRREGLLGI
jgi:hypothetical protein